MTSKSSFNYEEVTNKHIKEIKNTPFINGVAKDSKKLNIATFLRWYEPDQVQRDQENLSQPVGTPSGLPINLCLTYHIF
jgi:ferritin